MREQRFAFREISIVTATLFDQTSGAYFFFLFFCQDTAGVDSGEVVLKPTPSHQTGVDDGNPIMRDGLHCLVEISLTMEYSVKRKMLILYATSLN